MSTDEKLGRQRDFDNDSILLTLAHYDRALTTLRASVAEMNEKGVTVKFKIDGGWRLSAIAEEAIEMFNIIKGKIESAVLAKEQMDLARKSGTESVPEPDTGTRKPVAKSTQSPSRANSGKP